MAVTRDPALDAAVSTDGALDDTLLQQFGRDFAANPERSIAQNAVTNTPIDDVALNHSVVVATQHSFSHKLDDWKVTNQQQSGRCWMFAGLNLLRVGAMQKMNLQNFEFSQAYTQFYDKLERANYFLEAIIETAGDDVDDRTVAHLLDRPLDDGGQWNMFTALVNKHGLVPQTLMPETKSSSSTRAMNRNLVTILHRAARDIRAQQASGESIEKLRQTKEDTLAVIHRALCIHLGTPPEVVEWQWTDRDGEFHRDEPMTPQEFAQRYITLPIDEFVCLVHDPRNPTGQTYTVQYLGNVVGGPRVTYLNIDMDRMKQITRDTIVDGEPVWFGCDVGKSMQRNLGIWDTDLYTFDQIYETDSQLSKADRLEYHQTQMTHAMLFTGVDLTDSGVRRWRVENSWGTKNGQDGYYTMNDNWFAEHVFEIAARRSALPADLQAALELEPTVLPPWDPMGALAR